MGEWHSAEGTIKYRSREEGSAAIPQARKKNRIKNTGVWRSGSAVDS